MSTIRTTAERIEAKRAEMEQKKNELNLLLQKQKKEERKARTHRFCKRHALVEKVLPDLTRITDEQFDIFVEKTLLTGFADKILKQLTAGTGS
jgi:hypothetical protein